VDVARKPHLHGVRLFVGQGFHADDRFALVEHFHAPIDAGLAVGFGLFWLIGKLGTALFKKDAMGFGDVKLMGGLGALLGWQAVLFILFFSALAGSVIGIALIAMNKKELSSRIPYGPYLALAAFAWMLGGYRLWEAYLALMGF